MDDTKWPNGTQNNDGNHSFVAYPFKKHHTNEHSHHLYRITLKDGTEFEVEADSAQEAADKANQGHEVVKIEYLNNAKSVLSHINV